MSNFKFIPHGSFRLPSTEMVYEKNSFKRNVVLFIVRITVLASLICNALPNIDPGFQLYGQFWPTAVQLACMFIFFNWIVSRIFLGTQLPLVCWKRIFWLTAVSMCVLMAVERYLDILKFTNWGYALQSAFCVAVIYAFTGWLFQKRRKKQLRSKPPGNPLESVVVVAPRGPAPKSLRAHADEPNPNDSD